ncbi:MAG: HAD hydrolase family protein [Phycisphaerales bacterium]|jgi:hypothetical protein|nr:HAD hydrolase family protein [Phycisphaerales bacterium]
MHERWDILVVDLDGTLLCKRGEVSDENRRSFDAVRDAGIEIVVATGRCFAECAHILKKIDHVGATIVAGGSQLCDAEGTVLVSDHLDPSIVLEVAEHVLRGGHRLLLLKDIATCGAQYVLVGDAPLHHASTWWFDALGITLLEVPTIEEDPWPDHTLRAGAVAEELNLKEAVSSLAMQLYHRAKLQHWSAVTSSEATGSETHLLEVFGATVNKWTMLQKHLGDRFVAKRIVAIGDGLNDIEVLKEAGLSIAMENANEFVRSHADVVSGHHDEHGFAQAMYTWVLEQTHELERSR